MPLVPAHNSKGYSRCTCLRFAQGAGGLGPRYTSSPGRAGGQSDLRPLCIARPECNMSFKAHVDRSIDTHLVPQTSSSSSTSFFERFGSSPSEFPQRYVLGSSAAHHPQQARWGTIDPHKTTRKGQLKKSWRTGGTRHKHAPISAGTALAFIWRNVGTTNSSRYLLSVSCSGASLNASAIVVSGVALAAGARELKRGV